MVVARALIVPSLRLLCLRLKVEQLLHWWLLQCGLALPATHLELLRMVLHADALQLALIRAEAALIATMRALRCASIWRERPLERWDRSKATVIRSPVGRSFSKGGGNF